MPERKASLLHRRVLSHAASGEAGVFEGLQSDEVVFGRYRREGRWSSGLVELLCRVLADGGTLIDGGANLGLVGLPVAARTPAEVWCFEPEPKNAALLRRNAARLARARARCVEAALYDRTGPAAFSLDARNAGNHRVVPDARTFPDGAATTVVMARRLDDVLGPCVLRGPVVMKLDLQGAEVHALRGARRILRAVELLVVEYWPAGLARQGSSSAELHAELSGFAQGCVLPQQGALPELVGVPALLDSLRWVRADDPGFFDLLLLRSSAHSPRWRKARAAMKTLVM